VTLPVQAQAQELREQGLGLQKVTLELLRVLPPRVPAQLKTHVDHGE
jgi:hypothetical protein